MVRIETMLSAVPFSARLSGQDLRGLLPSWAMQRSTRACEGGIVEQTVWSDNVSGLRITMHPRRFEEFSAVDWFVELTNTGQSDAPILEQVQALDATLDVADRRVDLSWANGSLCRMDDFLAQEAELGLRYDRTFSPTGGRSSNGVLPFMNLRLPGGGVVIGIGWSGQ